MSPSKVECTTAVAVALREVAGLRSTVWSGASMVGFVV
jgi:hypothetical protein